MPSPGRIRSLRLQRYFGDRIHDRHLWVINRQSVSRATAIGLFCAYLPLPLQMLPAALLAIFFRANLPISIVLVWISNPLTWILMFTPPYLLGLAITGETGISLNTITVDMMMQQFTALMIGSLIFASSLSIAGYILANVIWRMIVSNRWNSRQHRNRNRNQK
ncbi:MAG: DUF2062 domain-containing protein [bacterium]